MNYAVGIDIGGTNTRVAIIDEKLNIVERIQFRTNAQDPYETIGNIKKQLDKFTYEYIGVGVSCPGPLDLVNGIVLNTPNLKGKWWNFPITKELSAITGLPVFLENDANLAALAEATVGKGKGKRYVQFLTISTGVGSGLVIDKNIYIGAHGFAHEIANMCLWRDGPSHGTIYPGGIEAICSGTAITNRAIQAGLDVKHAGEVNDLAKTGNKDALRIMEDAKEYLANALATIYAIVDPEIIILGGSVALKVEGFVEDVEQRVKTKVYPVMKDLIFITKSNLNEDSGLIGAGCLAFNKT